jgi:hypothetical protein
VLVIALGSLLSVVGLLPPVGSAAGLRLSRPVGSGPGVLVPVVSGLGLDSAPAVGLELADGLALALAVGLGLELADGLELALGLGLDDAEGLALDDGLGDVVSTWIAW